MSDFGFMAKGSAGSAFTGTVMDYAAKFKGFHAIEDLYELLSYAVQNNASDVIMQTGRPPMAEIYGDLKALTDKPLSNDVLAQLFVWMTTQNNVIARLESGRDMDSSFEIPDRSQKDEYGDAVRHRFRLNLTAGQYIGAANGYQAVMRAIPIEPPVLTQVGFPLELVPHATPSVGMVLISGPTGSGKTTTFAGLIRYVLEGNTDIVGNILTYEAPIEYQYGHIASPCCTIQQHEIGKHIPSFADGIRNSMRRKPGLLVIGELRDSETMAAAVEASNTGHPLFSTVHANSSAHIIKRMVNKFPPDNQHQAYYDIVESTRLLMSQTLVKRADGSGRVCLREWLVVDEDVREELLEAGLNKHVSVIRSHLSAGGIHQSIITEVRTMLENGTIDKKEALAVLRRFSVNNTEEANALFAS